MVTCIERNITHHRKLLPSYWEGDDEETGEVLSGSVDRVQQIHDVIQWGKPATDQSRTLRNKKERKKENQVS